MRNLLIELLLAGSFLVGCGARHCAAAAETETVRSEPTYAGRTFDKWRIISINDLDSATRAQAFKAFAAFGQYGRTEEAVGAITAALAKERSPLALKEGYSALQRLGETGLGALIEGLKQDDSSHRLAAIETFNGYTTTVSQDLVSAVMDAIRDDDAKIRVLACTSLGRMAISSEVDFSKSPPAHRRPDGEIGPITARVVPVLCRALTDEDPAVRIAAVEALGNLGRTARGGAREFSHYFETLVADLTSSEPARSRSRNPEVQAALKTFSKIGPEPSDSIPLLKKLAEVPGYKSQAERVMAKIEPEP